MTIHPHRSCLIAIAVTIPLLLHFVLLWLYAVNAPRLDDFAEILTFLPDWHTASTFADRASLIFRDYQNHRYVLYHTMMVAADHINFRTSTLVANLAIPALIAAMGYSARHHPARVTLWILAPWLVCNLQAWRAMYWGPLGTTNLLYPLIALAGCLLATRKQPFSLASAAITAILLCLTHGSGPLLFLAIALLFVWQQRKSGGSRKTLLKWLAICLPVFLLEFVLFPPHSEAGYASYRTTHLLAHTLSQATVTAQGFCALFGSVLMMNGNPHTPLIASLLGAVEVAVLGWLIAGGSFQRYPALIGWLMFLLLTGAAIAAGRVSIGGIDQAMQGHYKLLSGLMLWLICAAGLQWLSEQRPSWMRPASAIVITAAILLYGLSCRLFIPELRDYQRELQADARQWSPSQPLRFPETRMFVRQPNLKMKAAIDGGFYDPSQH